jgi:hypothetical protein
MIAIPTRVLEGFWELRDLLSTQEKGFKFFLFAIGLAARARGIAWGDCVSSDRVQIPG